MDGMEAGVVLRAARAFESVRPFRMPDMRPPAAPEANEPAADAAAMAGTAGSPDPAAPPAATESAPADRTQPGTAVETVVDRTQPMAPIAPTNAGAKSRTGDTTVQIPTIKRP